VHVEPVAEEPNKDDGGLGGVDRSYEFYKRKLESRYSNRVRQNKPISPVIGIGYLKKSFQTRNRAFIQFCSWCII